MTIVYDRTAELADTDDGDGNNDITYRVVIDASQLSAATGNRASVKVRFGTGQPTNTVTITDMFIGRSAAAGNVYSFQNSPTRVTWGGQNDIDGSAASVQTSDTVTLPETYDEAAALVISFHASATIQFNSTINNTNPFPLYYKTGGNDASTQTATGYSTAGTTDLYYFIEEVDITAGAAAVLHQKALLGVGR